jgi:hypothetical protein
VSQQAIGISLGLLLVVLAFMPNKIENKNSLPIRLDGIKIIVVLISVVFWVNVFWR